MPDLTKPTTFIHAEFTHADLRRLYDGRTPWPGGICLRYEQVRSLLEEHERATTILSGRRAC
jgi:hypothetical protein